MKRTELKANRDKTREFVQRARANSSQKRRPVSPASKAQREKVKDEMCMLCWSEGPCDPAHLCARASGGCDSPDCVIALCRSCHSSFDEGHVDLEPLIALPMFATERAHMAFHMSFEQCRRRLNATPASGHVVVDRLADFIESHIQGSEVFRESGKVVI